jgi:transposase
MNERARRRLTCAEKRRLVNLAQHDGVTEAARALEVRRDTVYYWLRRFEEGGSENLRPRPRGAGTPRSVPPEVRARLLALKEENPQRSAPKVARLYQQESGQRLHRVTVWTVLKKGAR